MKNFKKENNHFERQTRAAKRNFSFLLFNIIAFMIYYQPVRELVSMSLHNNLYSHIIFVPLVSGCLLYARRKRIFANVCYAFPAILLMISGLLLYFVWSNTGGLLNRNDYYSLVAFSAVIFWSGGFLFFFGTRPFLNALFPLLFLFFMVPVPTFIIDKVIAILQGSSAEVTCGLFKLTSLPIARDGDVFHLPGLSIEVARQCSGIRSSLVLLMSSILLGNLFLKGWSKRLILACSVFPITVMKNALRIVTLSLLGAYVDIRVLSSVLHRRGGVFFFVIALSMVVIVLWALRLSEINCSSKGEP